MAEEKKEQVETSKPEGPVDAHREEKPNPDIKPPKYSIGVFTDSNKKK
jgi:hypothetical protein